jgi:hypothetical protein
MMKVLGRVLGGRVRAVTVLDGGAVGAAGPAMGRLEGSPHDPDRLESLDVRCGGLLAICLLAAAWLVGYGVWALFF